MQLSSPRIARRKTRVNALMLGSHNHRLWNMGLRFRGDDSYCTTVTSVLTELAMKQFS
jgi:hypothetical protein